MRQKRKKQRQKREGRKNQCRETTEKYWKYEKKTGGKCRDYREKRFVGMFGRNTEARIK